MDTERKEKLQRLNEKRATTNNNGNGHGMGRFTQNTTNLLLNLLTTRTDLLNKLFDPRRDIDEECGYPKVITDAQYRRMYDRGLGRRVVDVYPSETWKMFPEIYEDPDAKVNTPFEEALEKLEKSKHLLHYLQRADELSGVGHYGVILWGINDGKELKEPVDGWEQWADATGDPDIVATAPERKILYIRVLDESLVYIAEYERDVTNPRYGLPLYYNITLADPKNIESKSASTPPDTTSTKVHWTRITHVADNCKTSEVLGSPRQEPVWDRLCDLRKILSGSGEMYWRGGFPGLGLETQPGLEGAELDEDTIRQVMFDYMNGLQRYIALTGMTAKSLAPQIAEPTEGFETQIKAICVTMGVPYRVFMGIEEGVVSGDQATRAWEDRLKNRQARYVTPMIINPVLRRLVDMGVLPPTKEPNGWTVEWPEAMKPNKQENATITVQLTEALAKYVAGGVDTLVPPLEFLTIFCGLDDETAMSIIDAVIEHISGGTDLAQAEDAAAEEAFQKAQDQAAAMADTQPQLPAPGGQQPPPQKQGKQKQEAK